MRKFLPDSLVGPALRDDVAGVLPYFRAAPDRLYLREPSNGRTVFHLAALSPKPNLLRELITNLLNERLTYSLHDVDYDGCHPLHLCARLGHLEHLELVVRFCTTHDGRSHFPNPLVDNNGRSVASYARVPVEWQSYGAQVAEALTKPRPAVHPSHVCVDDIVTILQLKKPFCATPFPWSHLPSGQALDGEPGVAVSEATNQPSSGQSVLVVGGTSPSDSGADNAPLPPPAAVFNVSEGETSTAVSVDTSRSPTDEMTPPLSNANPNSSSDPSNVVTPVLSDAPSAVATTATIVHHPPPALNLHAIRHAVQFASLALPVSVSPPITEAFAALVVVKNDPIYVAQMICIKGNFQFDSIMFYHDVEISGPLTLRGAALQVEYYRPTSDPDVVLGCWRALANPDVVFFVCRRVPQSQNAGSSTKKSGRLKKLVTALDASLDLYAKQRSVTATTVLEGSGPRHSPSRPPRDESGNFSTAKSDSVASGVSHVGDPSSVSLEAQEEEEEGDMEPATNEPDFSVAEAVDIILHTLRQRLWGQLKATVCQAIRKVFVVKRFVRRVIQLRTKAIGVFLARLYPVVDAVRSQLEVRRISIHSDSSSASILSLDNVSMATIHDCCRRSVCRKDHRWHITAQEVFLKLAPIVVGAPDLQATLVRLLMDEWLLPTKERERLAAAAQQQQNATGGSRGGGKNSSSPVGSRGHAVAPPSSRHGKHSGASQQEPVVRCSPHSPIPYLVGSASDLRAMLLPKHGLQPKRPTM